MAPAQPRGAPAAREAVLPAAARRGRPAARPTRRGSRRRRPSSGSRRSGYDDPEAALRHLEALTSGVSRTANIQRTLLPAMLGWFADAPEPGRRAVRLPADLRGARVDALVPPDAARRGPGRRAAGHAAGHQPLRHRPAPAGARGRPDARPRRGAGAARRASRCSKEMTSPRAGTTTRSRRSRAVRAVRRRELFRIAAADLLGLVDVAEVGDALTDVTARDARGRAGRGRPGGRGRAARTAADPGGDRRDGPARRRRAELRQRRRRDVRARPAARRRPARTRAGPPRDVANELRRLLALPGQRPGARGRRRPAARGQAGPAGADPGVLRRLLRELVGGLGGAGAAAGRARWSATRDLCRRFVELVDPLRYPGGRASARTTCVEVRRIKARVDDERLPRGADPATHLKLGRGGLADVEWTVQLLQMRHAGRRARRCAPPGPWTALQAAVEADLLGARGRRRRCPTAWRTASGLRNAITQVRGKAADSLPRDTRERAAVAHIRGYPPGESDRDGRRLPAGHPPRPPGRRAGVLGLTARARTSVTSRRPRESEHVVRLPPRLSRPTRW